MRLHDTLLNDSAATLESRFTPMPGMLPEDIADDELMLGFLARLRDAPGPDLRAIAQMRTVSLSPVDRSGLGVGVEPWRGELHISCAAPEPWCGWDRASIVGRTADPERAVAMLLAATRLRPRPIEWKRELLLPRYARIVREPDELTPLRARLLGAGGRPLEEIWRHFAELGAAGPPWKRESGALMLVLLERAHDPGSPLACWCAARDRELTLSSRDGGPGVVVEAHQQSFTLSYPVDAGRAPWAGARFAADADSPELAAHMAAVALARLA